MPDHADDLPDESVCKNEKAEAQPADQDAQPSLSRRELLKLMSASAGAVATYSLLPVWMRPVITSQSAHMAEASPFPEPSRGKIAVQIPGAQYFRLTPDGSAIYLFDNNGRWVIYQAATLSKDAQEYDFPCRDFAFTPDGSALYAYDRSNSLKRFNRASMAAEGLIEIPAESAAARVIVSDYGFSPDSGRLYVTYVRADARNTILGAHFAIYAIPGHTLINKYDLAGQGGSVLAVNSGLAVSANGERVYISINNTLKIFQLSDQSFTEIALPTEAYSNKLLVSPDEQRIYLFASGQLVFRCLKMPSQELQSLTVGEKALNALALTPNGYYLFVSRNKHPDPSPRDGDFVDAYDKNHQPAPQLTAYADAKIMQVSPDNRYLYILSMAHNYLQRISLEEYNLYQEVPAPTPVPGYLASVAVPASPTELVLSPTEEELYILHSGSRQVSRLDTAPFTVNENRLTFNFVPAQLRLVENGAMLYALDFEHAEITYRSLSGLGAQLVFNVCAASDMAIDSNGAFLYAPCADSVWRFWLDSHTRKDIYDLPNTPTRLALTADNRYLFTIYNESAQLTRLDTTDGNLMNVNLAYRADELAISPDGEHVVVAHRSVNALTDILWSSNNQKDIPLEGAPQRIVFSPDGSRYYVSVDRADRTTEDYVAVFLSSTRQLERQLGGFSEPIGLAINAAGNTLYVANKATGAVTRVQLNNLPPM